MSKHDFINRLRTALSGNMPQAQVADHVKYYEEYIETQIRSGKREDEVLGALGDPRLIARTIVSTLEVTEDGSGFGQEDDRQSRYEEESYYQQSGYGGAYGYGGNASGSYSGQSSGQGAHRGHTGRGDGSVRVPGWVWALVGILIVILVFSLIFSVLSFLAPILIPVLVILFFVKLFRDWLN